MSALVNALTHRRFLVCAAVFLVTATGMRPAAKATALWLKKQPVSIRKPLREFDHAKLPGFQFVDNANTSTPEDVGTDEYIVWRFVPEDEDLRETGVAYLSVFYYTCTGSRETLLVPHTPDVCYRQGGNQVTGIGTLDVPLAGAGPETIEAKYVRFSHPTDPQNKDICVAYLFCVNGVFHRDRDRARLHLALPWTRAVYLAKIECVSRVPAPHRLQEALDACSRMLGQAITELAATHFPTQADIDAALGD